MSKLKYYSKTEYNNKERSWITKTYIYISCTDLSPLIEEAAIDILHSVYNRKKRLDFYKEWTPDIKPNNKDYLSICIYKEIVKGSTMSSDALILINILKAEEDKVLSFL
ncbi:hypothetical protein ACTQX2_00495 [Megamonas funiformis]|uniref:hypothetical protein n=1 Tax=Megamonas funiformis TaxID=437897 RepID=UPI003F9581EF